MKKNIQKLLVFIIFIVPFFSNGQVIDHGNVYLSFDSRTKWHHYTTKKEGLFLVNRPIYNNLRLDKGVSDAWVHTFILGFRLKKSYVEFGLAPKEDILNGFRIETVDRPAVKGKHIFNRVYESGTNYSLRYGRNIGKGKFKLQLSGAYILSKAHGYGGPLSSGELNTAEPLIDADGVKRVVYYTVRSFYGENLLLRNYYHSLNGNIGLDYQLGKSFSICANIGYTYGFNTLGVVDVKYTIDGYPEQHAINVTNGTNHYIGFGLRYYPFAQKRLLFNNKIKIRLVDDK